jgi:riboflavin synthase
MFTGLIEGIGTIARITPKGPDAMLVVTPSWPLAEAVLGESVAVNGACLTVTGAAGQSFSLDVSAETLSRTTLRTLKPGAAVNLERAMKLDERLGGHLVTGHVDCVGRLSKIERLGGSTRLYITIPPEHLRLVVWKGSVAVAGVSLTVNQVDALGCWLNVIPHTLDQTTLKFVKEGDSVNIETDLIGKYVARLFNSAGASTPEHPGLGREYLARMGF